MTKFRKIILAIWLAAIVFVLVAWRVESFLDRFDREIPGLTFFVVLAEIVFFALLIYWFFIAFSFILRKLFWRVGRRLALSYFLIGVLPFVCFAILLSIAGFVIFGVLGQATYRSERQATLTKLDQSNLEYALLKRAPYGALPSLEIIDSSKDPKATPEWLRKSSFSGLVRREDGSIAMVSAKIYGRGDSGRSVVLIQPVEPWAKSLEQKNGMIVAVFDGKSKKQSGALNISLDRDESTARGEHKSDDNDREMGEFFKRGWRWGYHIWGDIAPGIVDWKTGDPLEDMVLFTLFSNRVRSLLDFYFGSAEYINVVLVVVGSIAGLLLAIYLLATLFAGALIFSISRAVNKIEKGTKAVENGDFTYRIRMKPRNQLGEVAQSFDRMTASIGGLLHRVAEQERLQSEIDIAATIQRNLLPREGPRFRGVSFSAHFEPTASIGGDYYDVFNLDRTKLAVTIGDVSGHGLSTGLVMAMVKAAMTTLVEEGADEASLFRRLNDLVHRSTERRAFMTLAFTIFDLERRTLRHTNAGHLYPYRLRAGDEPFAIESSSLPLGVRDSIDTKTVEVPLLEGDTIVYLSDGIVEALNPDGDPFGFVQLEELLGTVAGESPAYIQTTILEAVAKHSVGRPADDDRTVMILRFDQITA